MKKLLFVFFILIYSNILFAQDTGKYSCDTVIVHENGDVTVNTIALISSIMNGDENSNIADTNNDGRIDMMLLSDPSLDNQDRIVFK